VATCYTLTALNCVIITKAPIGVRKLLVLYFDRILRSAVRIVKYRYNFGVSFKMNLLLGLLNLSRFLVSKS